MIANTGLIGITFWILACIGIENNKSIQQVLLYLLMGTLIILVGIAVEKLQNYRDELEEIRRQKKEHICRKQMRPWLTPHQLNPNQY